MDLNEAAALSDADFDALPIEVIKELAVANAKKREAMRQDNQLKLYVPVSDEARKFHLSTYHFLKPV